MLLIADSGATKTAWVLLDKSKQKVGQYTTMGFSPMFHDSTIITQAILKEKQLTKYAQVVEEIQYFGAGCSSAARCTVIEQALWSVFPKAIISVEHDLLASAIATCGNDKGIACILGTGSNSCYYDGTTKTLSEEIPSLDYILGDEGSGSWLGKKLVTNFLYKRLPIELTHQFQKKYPQINKEFILKRVYKEAHPKVFLASLTPFLYEHKTNAYIHQFLLDAFLEFVTIHVCIFPNHTQVPIHFVGSISHYFQEELQEVITQKKLLMGKVIKDPIYGLVDYFQKR